MTETVIHMHPMLRDQVLAGARTEAFRPGHRAYEPGPATILFRDGVEVPILITKVVHTQPSGKYRVSQDFLIRFGKVPEEDQDRITLLEWKLVQSS